MYEAGRKTLLSNKIEILTKRNEIEIRKVNPPGSRDYDTSKIPPVGDGSVQNGGNTNTPTQAVQVLYSLVDQASMQSTNSLINTLFGILASSRLREFRMRMFPNFLEFAKNVDIGDWRSAESRGISVYKDIDFYKALYEGGVISKQKYEEYANELLNRLPESIEIREDRCILVYKNRTVYIDAALSIAGRLFFGVDDEMWKKVEPLFITAIENGLDMSEDDIRSYIQLLNRIQTKPIEAAKEMIGRLSIEDEIRKIGDILMMTTDEEMIARRLTNYVLDIVEKISRKEELDRNVRLLKEIIA